MANKFKAFNKNVSADTEMKENTPASETKTVEEEIMEESSPVEVVVRKKVSKRKVFRNYSLSFELDDYNDFITYLNDNEIENGSKFIRDILTQKGVLKKRSK